MSSRHLSVLIDATFALLRLPVDLSVVRHWLFKVDYCTVTETSTVPFEPIPRI